MLRSLTPIFVAVALLLPSAASAVDGYKRTIKVSRGDTLIKIAKRHKVTVTQLRKWNRLRTTRIRVGQKLKIYSLTPKRPTRLVEYTIKRGDSLTRIAKKFNTTVAKIRRTNRLRSKSRIRAGKVLKIEVVGPKNPAVATGRPQYGKLVNGEQLKSGPGYYVKRPRNAWGTNETITLLMTVIPQVKKKWRRAKDIVVGDLSAKNGGYLPPHRSHQNGLDVDIGYYHKGRRQMKGFKSATSANIDLEKSWYILKLFIDTGQVDYIFVDYNLQALFRRYAARKGTKKAWLDTIFQYPRGRGRTSGLIRHSRGHRNHFHIRFKNKTAQKKAVQARDKP